MTEPESKRIDQIALMAHAIVTDEALQQKIVDGQDAVLDRMAARDDHALLMGFVEQALQMSASPVGG